MPWLQSGGYDVLRQTEENSCGYCCIGMCQAILDGVKPSENSIVQEGLRVGGSAEYSRSTRDMGGMVPTAITQAQAVVPTSGEGTYGHHLADILESFQINANYRSGGAFPAAMHAVGGDRMIIALINWTGGGGHWVLIVGRRRGLLGRSSTYTVLDPLGHVVSNVGSSHYTSPDGVATFARHWVEISGRKVGQFMQGVKVM